MIGFCYDFYVILHYVIFNLITSFYFFISPLFNQIKTHWDQDLLHQGDLAKRGNSTRPQ